MRAFTALVEDVRGRERVAEKERRLDRRAGLDELDVDAPLPRIFRAPTCATCDAATSRRMSSRGAR